MHYRQEGNRLIAIQGTTTMWLEPWGKNSLRVRMTKEAFMDANDWALIETPADCTAEIKIEETTLLEPWIPEAERETAARRVQIASITSGNITASFNGEGWLRFTNQNGDILTEEYCLRSGAHPRW